MKRRRDLEYERDAARARAEQCERDRARLHAALDALPVGVVVVDDAWRETFRNRLASTPVGDVGSDALVRGALATLLDTRTAASEVMALHGPPAKTVALRVECLDAGGAVALIEDASERARLDAVRKDFVANVNHELRTPIGALAVLAEAVQGERDPEVIARLTSRMLAEVARAQALIEDLLELSRVEHAGPRVCEWVPLSDLFDAAVQRVRSAAEQRGVAVQVAASTESVWGDRSELISAVGNLVDNAVKYSDEGGVVSVGAHVDGPWVDVRVHDAGIGIPAKDVGRIFERFYRVDRARARGTGGSGLGLAIVRHVAANHGGEVSVQSVEGEGSTFTLRLPQGP